MSHTVLLRVLVMCFPGGSKIIDHPISGTTALFDAVTRIQKDGGVFHGDFFYPYHAIVGIWLENAEHS